MESQSEMIHGAFDEDDCQSLHGRTDFLIPPDGYRERQVAIHGDESEWFLATRRQGDSKFKVRFRVPPETGSELLSWFAELAEGRLSQGTFKLSDGLALNVEGQENHFRFDRREQDQEEGVTFSLSMMEVHGVTELLRWALEVTDTRSATARRLDPDNVGVSQKFRELLKNVEAVELDPPQDA